MPRGRHYRDDDSWSDDSDDYRLRETRKIIRSHSRHNHHKSSRDDVPITFIENKLSLPGQDTGRSRSRSRNRSGSGERDSKTELLLAQLALQQERDRSRDRHREHSEDRYRQKYEDERRRKELEWQIEDAKRNEDKRREQLRRDLEEEDKKREEDRRHALAEAEAKEKAEKAKREKMQAEFKAEEARQKQKEKDEKERILLQAEFEKKEKEAQEEATKKRILAEIEVEKAKKKAEEEKKEAEFEAMIRERAIKHGMDPDKAVRQLKDKAPSSNNDRRVGLVRHESSRRRVKVRRDHILPQTLDSYKLSWRYYEDNPEFIIIEDEVDDDFLWELQTDSERIIKSRKLITPGYKKETITTLTPGGSTDSIRKKHGKYYMVRKRSVSRQRFGISDLI